MPLPTKSRRTRMRMMLVSRRDFLATASLALAAGPLSGEELTPGQYSLKLDTQRDGVVYVPRGYKPGEPMPLVVLLHGAGGSGLSTAYAFPVADELGFIIVAP